MSQLQWQIQETFAKECASSTASKIANASLNWEHLTKFCKHGKPRERKCETHITGKIARFQYKGGGHWVVSMAMCCLVFTNRLPGIFHWLWWLIQASENPPENKPCYHLIGEPFIMTLTFERTFYLGSFWLLLGPMDLCCISGQNSLRFVFFQELDRKKLSNALTVKGIRW